jgi:alkylation response protein AidB-like acyl-CoA dehydrogenase
MDFEEGDDVKFIRKTVSDFMKRFPPEYWRKADAERRFPEEYWRAAAEQGLLGISIPEKYGRAWAGALRGRGRYDRGGG